MAILTSKSSLTTPVDGDVLHIVDVSDTTSNAAGTSKQITRANLLSGIQAEPAEGAFVDGDKTKLDGIEAAADVTDTTNVTAAGALMDSEVTNLAQVKAFDSADYATAAQGAKVDYLTVTQAVDLDQMETDIAALANGMVYKGNWDASVGTFPGGGTAETGAFYTVSVGGTVDSVVFVAGDRLIAITDNASTTTYAANWTQVDATDAVQSVNSQTGTVVLDADDIDDTSTTNKFTTAGDISKLAGIEASADVTDATNVTTALSTIAVSALSDVDTDKLQTPADGDVLTFDGTHWNAETPAGGGSSAYRIVTTSDSLSTALTSSASDGKAIYLAEGTHTLTANTTMGTDIAIVGAGAKTILDLATYTLTMGTGSSIENIEIQPSSSASKVQMGVESKMTNCRIMPGYGGEILKTNRDSNLSNCYFYHGSTTAYITVDGSNGNPIINGCTFDYVGIRVADPCNITNSFFFYFSNPAIEFNSGGTSHNCVISGNSFRDGGTTDPAIYMNTNSNRMNIITGNYFQVVTNSSYAIRITSTLTGNVGNNITGNTFYTTGTTVTGVSLEGTDVEDTLVSSNVFNGFSTDVADTATRTTTANNVSI